MWSYSLWSSHAWGASGIGHSSQWIKSSARQGRLLLQQLCHARTQGQGAGVGAAVSHHSM